MSTNGALAVNNGTSEFQVALMEKVFVVGDLKALTSAERLTYYQGLCESLGLNPVTRPFEYITLDGKLTLYARKDCTEQLRRRDRVSIRLTKQEVVDGVYIVKAEASSGGRVDESTGAVAIEGLKGKDRANAMMKAETKAKRRVTLSFCGLGFLDESEIEDAGEVAPPAMTVEAADLADMDDERMAEIQAKLNAQAAPPKQAAAPTIVDPAEAKADAPQQAATKAASKPAEPVKAHAVTRTWTDHEWSDICLYFADGDTLAELRDHILRGMKFVDKQTGAVKDLRQINALGQETFMRRVAIEAERRDMELGVK